MENEVKEPAPKYSFISPEAYLAYVRSSAHQDEHFKENVITRLWSSKEHNLIFAD